MRCCAGLSRYLHIHTASILASLHWQSAGCRVERGVRCVLPSSVCMRDLLPTVPFGNESHSIAAGASSPHHDTAKAVLVTQKAISSLQQRCYESA